ncbi:MAG: ArnT family glycosyltransferase, partial [Fibrobacterota bacterium]
METPEHTSPIRDRAFLLILGISLVVRLLWAAVIPASNDEAYYCLYTANPALSYFDHPSMVALTGALFSVFTEGTPLYAMRLGSILLFTVTLGVLFTLTTRLFSRRAALWTAGIAAATPLFAVGAGTLILPDAPLAFFWSLSLLMLHRIFVDQRPAGALAVEMVAAGDRLKHH